MVDPIQLPPHSLLSELDFLFSKLYPPGDRLAENPARDEVDNAMRRSLCD